MIRRGAPLLYQPKLAGEPAGRIAPVQELINTFEFEATAQRKLDSVAFAEIAGSERSAFDRITYRPRMMVDTTKMDLTTRLFGHTLFTPILIGPTSQQKRFHPEGELAMARGASAAKAVMVVSDRSSYPLEEIAAQAKAAWWYQISPEREGKVRQAIDAGCGAVLVTIGTGDQAGVDWSAMDRLRQGIKAPVVLKGIMSPEEAEKAIGIGAQGIVISNYAPHAVTGVVSPIEMLPSIVNSARGKLTILIDGSFRRGSDILKALALGAQAVLLGRPPLWGLAAYGAEGVQRVVELLQTELARDMAGCGRIDIPSIDASIVRIHRR